MTLDRFEIEETESGRYINICARERGSILFTSEINFLFNKYPNANTVYIQARDRDGRKLDIAEIVRPVKG